MREEGREDMSIFIMYHKLMVYSYTINFLSLDRLGAWCTKLRAVHNEHRPT